MVTKNVSIKIQIRIAPKIRTLFHFIFKLTHYRWLAIQGF